MRRNLFKSIIIILFLIYSSTLWANGILQYFISQKKVETAKVFDNKDGSYSVVIELKEPYKKEFAKLTAKHIGRKLQIVFKKQILVQATIRDEIPSGIMIIGNWTSAEEAFRFIETLQGSNKKQGMDTQ